MNWPWFLALLVLQGLMDGEEMVPAKIVSGPLQPNESLRPPDASTTLQLPLAAEAGGTWQVAVKGEPAKPSPQELDEPDLAVGEPAVRKWIDDLVALESFDTGLSPTHGGSDFPPVDGQLDWSVATLSERQPHRRSEAVKNLVAAGADALPLLLEHLDDKRPTKLTVNHETMFGGMWHAAEVPSAVPNAREKEAFKTEAVNREEKGMPHGITTHTVTVGDVCFVIIGMISNRPYNAVRYQPTACIVVNSPTSTPAITAAVRKMWGKRPGRAELKAWLDEDLSRGVERAATRLLFYFPDESKAVVAKRLAGQLAANDDRAVALVRAVAWHEDPAIRQMIRSAAMKSRDTGLVHAALPAFAVAGDGQGRKDLEKLVARWKSRDRYLLEAILATALRAHPARAENWSESVLQGGNHEDRLACLGACSALAVPPVKPLIGLLGDRSPGIGHYLIEGPGVRPKPEAGDFLAHRVCDNAWELICRALGDPQARCTGQRKTMDRRIAELRERLAGEQSRWPFTADEAATREQERTARLRELREREARLQTHADQPSAQDMAALEDPGLTPDHWRAAAARLFSPPGEKDSSLVNAVANRRLQRELAVDSLSDADRGRLRTALEKQADRLLDASASGWPSADAVGYFALAQRACPAAKSPLRSKMLVRLEQVSARRLPGDSGVWDAALVAIGELLDGKTEGAGELFSAWCGRVTPQSLEDDMALREFVEVMVNHREIPAVAAAAERMFTGKKSAWNPLRLDYSTADSIAEANALKLAAFRRALHAALSREDIVGELAIRKDKPDYCWIEWSKSSSGMGVGENQPRGVEPGGPPMPVRRCDMLLEAVTGTVFADHDGPEFHIYWPLGRRNEARNQWRKWLAGTPGKQELNPAP